MARKHQGSGYPIYKGSRRRLQLGGFYSAPSYMTGGLIYSGSRRRLRGGGFLGSMRSVLAPVGRQALQGLKSLARNQTVRNFAKEAAKRGTEVLAGVAVDALQGRNVGESLKQRSREMALQTLTGENKPPKRKKMIKTKKQFKQSRKRKNPKSQPQPPQKRRRLSRAANNRKSLF